MNKGFEIKTENKIAEIILNRPEKKNSLLPAFWKEFPNSIKEISNSGKYRVLILSGQGDDFCAGMDLSVFAGNKKLKSDSPGKREHLFHMISMIQDAITELEHCRIPVIAAIKGHCLGAGLDIVSACDLRYSTNNARFRIEETNVGIMADLGSLQRLPKLMPEAIVKELSYRGNTLSAQRAFEIGFVNQVFLDSESLIEGVKLIAEEIAAKAPLVISASKRSINYAREHSTIDSLNQAALLQSAIFDLSDVNQYMQSKAGKADPLNDLKELDTEL